MADYDASPTPILSPLSGISSMDTNIASTASPGGGSVVVKHYRMLARDTVCVVQPSYVVWEVTGTPDTTGARCPLLAMKCGADPLTDLADFSVLAFWTTST